MPLKPLPPFTSLNLLYIVVLLARVVDKNTRNKSSKKKILVAWNLEKRNWELWFGDDGKRTHIRETNYDTC